MNTEVAVADRPAKFSAPVATHVVDRPRLYSRLTEGLDAGTTLVAAAAGWGKTLLVGSWVAAGPGDRAVAWVSLDGADDDPHEFWRTMATAVLPVADDAARDGLRRVASAGTGDPDLPSELAAALGRMRRRVVVVLDNLHEVHSPDVHAGLVRLVERPLPALALIVTTRHDPPWPLQRLRLAGVLTEVRARDVAFQPDEAAGRRRGRRGCAWPPCTCADVADVEREKTILRYLASALSNAEITTELYVSVNTVKTHQRTVYRKLGAAGRRDTVRRARALRLL